MHILSANDAIESGEIGGGTLGEDLTVTTTVGNLYRGTSLLSDTKIKDIIKNMIYHVEPVPPSTEYASIQVDTWNNIGDVDRFFDYHNHNNGYNGLKLGNMIQINDGTYNVLWEIAGFDCENGHIASDGTSCENGVGICMIPRTQITKAVWNTSNTVSGGYKASNIHNNILPTVCNNLYNVLGNHMVLRNVLLSNATNGTSPRSYTSSSYTWTTSYATLLSYGQLSGEFASRNNKYDDGEANYKLPLFNYESFAIGSGFWLRGVYGYDDSLYFAWNIFSSYVNYSYVTVTSYGVRPLIYLR